MTAPARLDHVSRVEIDRRPGGMPQRSCLVRVRLGAGSLHYNWFDPTRPRRWDLLLHYWQDDPRRHNTPAEIVACGGIGNYIGLSELHEADPLLFAAYDTIILLDDDLMLDHADIDRMIDLFERHELMLAQPALTPDSYYSYEITRQVPGVTLRFTNWVEVMAPIFSRGAFLACAETFHLAISAWGISRIWTHLLGWPATGIAILDAVPVHHTKPVDSKSGPLYQQVRRFGTTPMREVRDALALYGLPNFGPANIGLLPGETLPPGYDLATSPDPEQDD